MITEQIVLDEAERLLSLFLASGAQRVEPMLLQPARSLLDLYGENIRARAYVTHDPVEGEVFLRPDFTVPIAQMHLREKAQARGRYTYAGRVFRKQELDPERAREFYQVGIEIFGEKTDPAQADANLFALIYHAMENAPLRIAFGDIALLKAAIDGLTTSTRRRAALHRHIWRPKRFRALLERFANKRPEPASRKRLRAIKNPMQHAGPVLGLRSEAEILERIAIIEQDASAAPISPMQFSLVSELLEMRAAAPQALELLRDLAVDLPSIADRVDIFAARLDALDALQIDINRLEFEASYGRTSMEYYDGFVFGFYPDRRADLPPIASGGRYDAMTAALGDLAGISALGAVVRPDLLQMMRGGAK